MLILWAWFALKTWQPWFLPFFLSSSHCCSAVDWINHRLIIDHTSKAQAPWKSIEIQYWTRFLCANRGYRGLGRRNSWQAETLPRNKFSMLTASAENWALADVGRHASTRASHPHTHTVWLWNLLIQNIDIGIEILKIRKKSM